MRKSLTILFPLVLLVTLSGCRGKPHPELFRPHEEKAWPTVEVDELKERQQSLRKVEMVTSMGRIVFELFEDQAPVSVANFIDYVESGFYPGTIFHRVEPGLVVQGGGFTVDMIRKATNPPVDNEAGNGLRNMRGTLGLARTSEMNSGTSQFYINLVDNPGFNGDGITSGYAVFGRVYEGMSVIDAMALVDTGSSGGMSNVPVEPIIVLSARVLE
jgi:peptidyl-prolyl cis-trans isomerase A (cyclophilin A)